MWGTAGPAAGRAAPGAVRGYYDAVVASLARSLVRIEGVEAVYAAGSYGTGTFVPGGSDVDLVAGIVAPTPEEQLRILRAARTAYRLHQAVLPIDLSLLPADGFPRAAAVHALFRRRIAAPVPRHPVETWRLLAGTELRGPVDDPPDPRLVRPTDSHVVEASELLLRGDGQGVLRALFTTAKDLAAEGLDGAALTGDPARALEAALGALVASREREALPVASEPPDVAAWRVAAPEPPPEAVAAARDLAAGVERLRSATAYAEPFTGRPSVLLEAATAADAVAVARAVRARAAALHDAAVAVAVLPTPLAEDPWGTSLRAVAVAAAGVHVAGEPLAPRLRHGPEALRRRHAAVAAAMHWWRIEPVVLGRRFIRIDESIVLRLAAHALIAAGGPALIEPRALAGAVPALAGHDLARLVAPDRDALGAVALRILDQTRATPPARIRSGSMSW